MFRTLVLSHLKVETPFGVGTINIPTLEVVKLRFNEELVMRLGLEAGFS